MKWSEILILLMDSLPISLVLGTHVYASTVVMTKLGQTDA